MVGNIIDHRFLFVGGGDLERRKVRKEVVGEKGAKAR
jgi:hypothetical protein